MPVRARNGLVRPPPQLEASLWEYRVVIGRGAWRAGGLDGHGMACLSALMPAAARALGAESAGQIAPATAAIVVTGQAIDLEQAPAAGKTGTPLAEIPASIQVIDRGTIDAQGGVSLQDAIGNASGVGRGGGDGFGFTTAS